MPRAARNACSVVRTNSPLIKNSNGTGFSASSRTGQHAGGGASAELRRLTVQRSALAVADLWTRGDG